MWNLIKKFLPLLKENTLRLPGNGREINVWNDSIMGKPPLAGLPGIQRLKMWMSTRGLTSLESISQWNQHDNTWKNWKSPNLPQILKNQWETLISLLKGDDPINKDT